MNRSVVRLTFVPLLALCFAAPHRSAAQAVERSKLRRQLEHVDLGIQGMGFFTKAVSGPVVAVGAYNYGEELTENGSNTVGALATLRYSPKPYAGVEFNYGEARYTVGFPQIEPYQVQTQYNEFTLGYVIEPPHTFFGIQPVLSAGAGTIYFKPTKGGGQEEPKQPRAVYYYNIGLQHDVLPDTFGIRVGWRQVFYLAPDFLTNYETILQHTTTSEPYAGFYLRF